MYIKKFNDFLNESDEKTNVVFYIDTDGQPLAYFPDIDGDNKGNKTCYSHVGQHSGCHPDYVKNLKLATPDEYKDLEKELIEILNSDLSKAAGATVSVQLQTPEKSNKSGFKELEGKLLDRLDLDIDPHQQPDAALLSSDASLGVVEETLVTHLLRSNCPVTGQPDWASVQINYVGPTIHEESLLRYLIAFREHQEFHEHCVEKIFIDIKEKCHPTKLSVYARYTRRGGIDINPFRADYNAEWPLNIRQIGRAHV